MRYDYRCKPCNNEWESTTHGLETHMRCSFCGGPIVRRYSVAVKRDLPEHFNTQLGRPISGMNQLKRELHDQGEKQWQRTGIPHRYIPMDYRELPQPAETLAEHDKKQLDEGWRDRKFIAPITR